MIAMDETAGEDPEVRRIALKALGNHAGTVVVMDPNTGQIYSVVNQQWALREGFKPCSTIKLITGLAGLNEKLIDPSAPTRISTGSGRDLTSALAHSNNEYFQQVGGRVGFDKFLFYARQLGLGEKTGINAKNESAGRVPEFKSGYALNHMSSHGDDFQVTAVQLATLVSAMTNGGKLLSPFIPRISQEENRIKPHVRRQVKIDTEVWSQMIPGMIGAVNYGSGRKAYNPSETIAGKTGTCIQDGNWVGLFASYAPLDNPRLAVVVIGLGPDGRGHFPAAVAGEIYRNLNHRFGTPVNEQIAKSKAPANQPAPTAVVNRGGQAGETPKVAGLNLNRESASVVQKSVWINNAPKGGNTVKSVLMTIPKRTPVVNPSPKAKTEQQATRPRRVSSIGSSAGGN
jgi:cell division protein FtsI/penicillin-binding protein 2